MVRKSLRRLLPALWLIGAFTGALSQAADRSISVAPGVLIHVVEVGSKDAQSVVFIPGWRLTTHIFAQQIEALAPRYRVIVLDPRSQGESTKTEEGDTPEQRARDLHQVLEVLKVQQPLLVGWSQGVQDVAAYVAQFDSTDFKGLVLVDSTVSGGAHRIEHEQQASALQLERLWQYAHHPEAASEAMMKAIIQTPQSDAQLKERVLDALKTPTAIGAAMLLDDLWGPDRTGALEKIRVPTLIIASSRSNELEGQRAMARRIAGARFEVLNAGHAVFVDQPERFDALIEKFLRSL